MIFSLHGTAVGASYIGIYGWSRNPMIEIYETPKMIKNVHFKNCCNALGYGCERKKIGEPCQKGCHGFSFPLDDSILDMSRNIELWIDKELSCL